MFVAAVHGGGLGGVARTVGCGQPHGSAAVGMGAPADGGVRVHKGGDVKLEVALGHLPRHHLLYHILVRSCDMMASHNDITQ